MAVTKTHPIKSTLKAAIDYILNPEKTDGKLLASSFGCGLETADIEFAWTREAAGDRGTHLGRHLIQSFAVGETTPEEAHKIGMELAGAVLGGKYEFVLTTHVDKDHLHNHLIFNAVSFVDYKKYHSNKQSYHFIRRTSDRICKEHGLSVVVPGQDKGKSYAEYTAEKQGTSYKAKLKTAIDKPALPRSSRQAGERRRLPRRSWSWLPAQCSQRPHPGRSADGCASCVPLGITFAATPFPGFQAAGFSSSRPQSRLAIPRGFFLSVSSWVVTPFYLSA